MKTISIRKKKGEDQHRAFIKCEHCNGTGIVEGDRIDAEFICGTCGGLGETEIQAIIKDPAL